MIYGEDSLFARDMTYASLASRATISWRGMGIICIPIASSWASSAISPLPRRMAAVTKAFGDWEEGAAAASPSPMPRTATGARRVRGGQEDVDAGVDPVGHQGTLLSTHPDFYAVEVLNEVLSGQLHVASVLECAHRQRARLHGRRRRRQRLHACRAVPMKTSTKTETTVGTIETMVPKPSGASRPPTDAELGLAKQSILNSFIFNSRFTERVLGQQIPTSITGSRSTGWIAIARASRR